jgi:glycosyltransferase involved in cell wall biosynthesis
MIKKSIVIFLHDDNIKSGATASMLTIIEFLLKKEDILIDIIVPTNTSNIKHFFIAHNNISVSFLKYSASKIGPQDNLITLLIVVLKNLLSILNLIFYTIKNKRKYDFVITNTLTIYMGFFFSRFKKIKHIWFIREFGIEDQNFSSINLFGSLRNKLKQSYCFFLSNFHLTFFMNKYGLDYNKLFFLYDDFPTEKINRPVKLRFQKNTTNFLFSGGIVENKGLLIAISALSKIKLEGYSIKLMIAGNTNTRFYLYLLNYIKENKLDFIEFLGFVNNLDSIRENVDISLIPSYFEAFGRVAVESLNSSNLVIASNSGSLPEILSNGKYGILFEQKNVFDLYSKVKYVLDNKNYESIHKMIRDSFIYSLSFYSNLSSIKFYDFLTSKNNEIFK